MGMNMQQYVWVRLKALGAINSSNCHVDDLRGPTGGPKASSSIETIAMCDSDGRGAKLGAGGASCSRDVMDGLGTWMNVSEWTQRLDKRWKQHKYGCERDRNDQYTSKYHENAKLNSRSRICDQASAWSLALGSGSSVVVAAGGTFH